MAAQRLFTIGYEGRTSDEVIAMLLEAKVQVLVDARAVPMSRKPNFRKNVWAGLLNAAGIEYYSAIALGTPRDIRDRLKDDGNYKKFFSDYRRHMRQQREPMFDLKQLVAKKRIALMCFEADAMTCHRSAVADWLGSMTDLQPVHLGSPDLAASAVAARRR